MKAFYIPNGPKNLFTMFPTIDFDDVQKYYIEVKDDTDTVIATTTISEVKSRCCGTDKIRVHFLNGLGAIDAVNFKRITVEHETTSGSMQRPLGIPLVRKQHFTSRFNVKANDLFTLSTIDYNELDMKWLEELVDSPLAWIEWAGEEGEPDDYIPIDIQDMKMLKIKAEDRYEYELVIQCKLSHDKIIIRN